MLLRHHLKGSWKLPTMTAECERGKAGAKENVDHLGFLLQLAELELLEGGAARRPGGG